MTDIGESISIAEVASEDHDDDCYFCNAEVTPTSETSDLVDNPDEDAAEMEDSLGEYK